MTTEKGSGAPGLVTRRALLAAGAAAGAGLVLPARAGSQEASSSVLKLALIGAGTQGRDVLMENCFRIPGVRFQAICDIWPYHRTYASRLLKRRGHEVAVYEDYRELLAREQGLDAVLVATPEWMHAEQAVACLRAGLHVYCEKEMSNSLEGARAMVRAARESGRLLQIGHQRRSNPIYLHAKQKLLGEGKLLGRITHVYGQWNRAVAPDIGWPRGQEIDPKTLAKYGYEDMQRFRNWRWYRKYGGGPIVDLGSHQIDIYHWFLGALPRSVMASGGVDYYQGHEWPDNVLAIYDYETPAGVARAYYQVLTTTSAQGYFERFMGDEGTLQISEDPGKVRVYAEARTGADEKWRPWVKKGYIVRAPEPEQAEPAPKDEILAVYESEKVATWLLPLLPGSEKPYHLPHLENFFEAVRGQARLTCPAEVGYETAVAVLKVNQAVEAGRRLAFDSQDWKA